MMRRRCSDLICSTLPLGWPVAGCRGRVPIPFAPLIARFSTQTRDNREGLGLKPRARRSNLPVVAARSDSDIAVARASIPSQRRLTKLIAQAAQQKDWDAATAAFAEAKADPLGVCPRVYSSMLHATDRCNKLREAMDIYAELMAKSDMPKNAAMFTSVIALAGRRQRVELALEIVDDMHKCGVEPNAHTCSALIHMYKHAQQPEDALRVYREMRAKGVEVDTVLLSAIMSALAKTGDVAATESLLEEAVGKFDPDCTHLNCILDACKVSEDPHAALRVLAAFRSRGVGPNVISYTCIMGALRSRPVEEAHAVYKEMNKVGIAPNGFFLEEYLTSVLRFPVAEIGLAPEWQASASARDLALELLKDARSRNIPVTRLLHRVEAALMEGAPSSPGVGGAADAAPDDGHDWVKVLQGGGAGHAAGDDASPAAYYWDRVTGRTQWEPPPTPPRATIVRQA